MSSWSDWLPTSVGDLGAVALGGPVGLGAKKYFFDQPAKEAKSGYDTASGMTDAATQKIMDFYLGQQKQAQANYKPLQAMFSNAYGTAGIQAPKLPGGGR